MTLLKLNRTPFAKAKVEVKSKKEETLINIGKHNKTSNESLITAKRAVLLRKNKSLEFLPPELQLLLSVVTTMVKLR